MTSLELGPPTSRARIRRLREKLLGWYDTNHRDLPWRRSRDPYAIWISETMLQQTRVETVIPYYERFLARFPDIESLATADRDDVYEHWAGLGYYSRARNLHNAAQMMVGDFEGRVPEQAEDLKKLPGVGRYTAGAVASIAYGQPEAVVDGNVIRVLTRLLDIRSDVAQKNVVERLWHEAGALALGERPGDFNQALMELGATVCTPRSPRCKPTCPLVRMCHSYAKGDVESLPNKPKNKKPRPVEAVAVWIPRRERILTVQRPETGLLANLWELPGGELPPKAEAKDHVEQIVRERVGLSLLSPTYAGTVEHVFTHLKMQLHLFRTAGAEGRVRNGGHQAHQWIAPDRFDDLPVSTLARKAFELLQ
ncbi:MAG: A/G-specific adenine glycosylase [Myxococcota bacterium]|nr:A/G-specific adenine glycosylase [Myxococcota bacterium]